MRLIKTRLEAQMQPDFLNKKKKYTLPILFEKNQFTEKVSFI